MKYFVPQYQHIIPYTTFNKLDAFANSLIEITPQDLSPVLNHWEHFEEYYHQSLPKDVFFRSSDEVCSCPAEPLSTATANFLWRPGITVHCGSWDATEELRVLLKQTGSMIAKLGFNLWYGGGDSGLMGEAFNGFNEEVQKHRFENQVSIQVIPAPFIRGIKSQNGLTPKNEGLTAVSDAVIVLPTFSSRRDLLNRINKTIISAPGSFGTLDEMAGVLTDIKTGLLAPKLSTLDPYMMREGRKEPSTFYAPLWKLVRTQIDSNLQSDSIWSQFGIKNTVEELAKDIKTSPINPHECYKKARQSAFSLRLQP